MESKPHSDQKELFIGVDIGGTKCAVVAGDSSFSIRRKIAFETKTDRGYQAILNEFIDHIRSLLLEFPENRL